MNRRRLRFALATVALVAVSAWFRVTDLPQARAADRDPARALGLGAAFDAELAKVGQLSPKQFADKYGRRADHLPKLTWNPTTAEYWDRLNLDPNKPGQRIRLRGEEERQARQRARQQGHPYPDDKPVLVETAGGYDFRLDADERARFETNGFVVSGRMSAPSCTEMFYRIYKRDLPVFISTDAILHAWHRSFDAILEEVETSMLLPALDDILAGMAGQVQAASNDYGRDHFADSLADADYFLAVAQSLLRGKEVPTALPQGDRVAKTLAACTQLQLETFKLFDLRREVDFSQFKPRGHYEKTEVLRRYFRAMMWCGRIDLRVAGDPKVATPRQLGGALVLHDLLRRSGRFGKWEQFDRMLRTFVGRADSMTFAQLGEVLSAAGVRSPASVKNEAGLADLQQRILAGKFGAQEIRGDVFIIYPSNPEKYVLPRSFTLLGQRFAIDSWATSQVVYDDIKWDGRKVMRRIPSSLDVAFAALGNDAAVPMLHDRMTDVAGRKFRDGLNYQHNLTAVREVIDRQPEKAWSDSLYTGWLSCLRELSKPTAGEKYPEAMRTSAWAMKSLNTQLASWTQLRHDTILYVKQSYTGVPACHYPAGFVEPVPHFWAKMEQMAARVAKLIEQTPYSNIKEQEKQAKFLAGFAVVMKTLRQIAEKELAQQALSPAETKFLEDVIEVKHVRFGSGQKREYLGWYPGLFYAGTADSEKWDALVADVHTNPPAEVVRDPGCVLHQGVGSVDLLVVAVDSGKNRMIYAGPTLSHYEFEMPGVSRKTDVEWKKDVREGRTPPRPMWTRDYLVPGVNKGMRGYMED